MIGLPLMVYHSIYRNK